MGAESFLNIGKGKTAQLAFEKLVEKAQWDYGHRGYTGTIAEKGSFTEFIRPKGMRRETLLQMVDQLQGIRYDSYGQPDVEPLQALYPKFNIQKMYSIYDSKWGPALCISLSDTEYLFTGYASS